MADIVSKEQRSRNMSAIRSKNTSDEILFRKWLYHRGYRYSLHSSRIPGHPDLYLKKYNTAVFIHGCFWHRHPDCKYAYTPKSRVDFWTQKFNANIARDNNHKNDLKQQGIKCLVVWECTVNRMKKNSEYRENILNLAESFFRDNCLYYEL